MLVAVLAQDGGRPVETLYSVCGDAPLMTAVDGGFLVPFRRQQRNNCKLAACEDYANAQMSKQPDEATIGPGTVAAVAGAGVVLAAIAAAIAYFAPHPTK